jgi:hypothetical protein
MAVHNAAQQFQQATVNQTISVLTQSGYIDSTPTAPGGALGGEVTTPTEDNETIFPFMLDTDPLDDPLFVLL